MRLYDYIHDFVDFTASIPDIELYKPQNLVALHLSVQGNMTAASAVSPEALLGLINPLEIKVAAIPRIRLTGRDIWAFDALFLRRPPQVMRAGATTGDRTRVMDLVVPLNVSTAGPPVHMNITRTAVSGVGTEKLTTIIERSEEALAERPLQMLGYTFVPTATGTMLRALERVNAGDLEAILFRSTTIPTNTADTSSLAKLELYVNGELRIRTREWQIYKEIFHIEDAAGTPTARSLDNYMILDFRPEPIPAGASIRLDIAAGDTNAITIIPIERLPPL